MFRASRILKASIKNNSMNVPLKEFVEVHTSTTSIKIDAFKGQLESITKAMQFQFKVMNGIIMIGGGGMAWFCLDEREKVKDEFKEVKADIKEIKDLILSSNVRK